MTTTSIAVAIALGLGPAPTTDVEAPLEAEPELDADADTDLDVDVDEASELDPEPEPEPEPKPELEPQPEPERAPPQFGSPDDPESPTPPTRDDPDYGSTIGGYWGPTDTKELPPPDGRRKILIGSIVGPLGAIAMATGAGFAWMTVPEHCVERGAAAGFEIQRKRCGGLFTLNIVRASYGGLMLITGTVFLVLGVRERNKRREWDRHHTADVGGLRLGKRLRLQPSADGVALRF